MSGQSVTLQNAIVATVKSSLIPDRGCHLNRLFLSTSIWSLGSYAAHVWFDNEAPSGFPCRSPAASFSNTERPRTIDPSGTLAILVKVLLIVISAPRATAVQMLFETRSPECLVPDLSLSILA